jgi:predicted nucleic acid-binding protein
MNLNAIKSDSSILIDANIFIYAMQKLSKQCERLLSRCSEGEVQGVVPLHILAEVMHIMMITEARDNSWISGSNPGKSLSEKPERVRSLVRYESFIRDILIMGFHLEPVSREDFITALSIQRKTGLLTNDALLAAVGERLRVAAIASADKVFSRIQGMQHYSPTDMES